MPHHAGAVPADEHLTWDVLKAAWGTSLEDFSLKAMAIIKARGEIHIKSSSSAKTRVVPWNDISATSLAFVTYKAMQGRYTEQPLTSPGHMFF